MPLLRSRLALTVVFPEPADPIVRSYQLACHCGEAHSVFTPNITDTLLDRFLCRYGNWWRRAAARDGTRPAARRRPSASRPGVQGRRILVWCGLSVKA